MTRETILKIADKAILDYETEINNKICFATSDCLDLRIENIIDEYNGIDEFESEKQNVYNAIYSEIRKLESRE